MAFKRTIEDIIDLTQEEEDIKHLKVTVQGYLPTERSVSDLQIHTYLSNKYGPKYFQLLLCDPACNSFRGFIDLGFSSEFLIDFIENGYWKYQKDIYDQGDLRVGQRTIDDNPARFYYDYQTIPETPKTNLSKVNKYKREVYKAIRAYKPAHKVAPISKIIYTGKV